MKPLDFFKLQSKNLFKDYKTNTHRFDADLGENLYDYNPKYFDVGSLLSDYEINEDEFSLMKAQHLIAQLAGFPKWTVLEKASEIELELAKLLFDNRHKVSAEEWQQYIFGVEKDNNLDVDHEFRLEVFQKVFAEVEDHQSYLYDYRLTLNIQEVAEIKKPHSKATPISDIQITSLPLSQEDRSEFIQVANDVFESVIERLEPLNPELTRKLWNPEYYVDSVLLPEIKLPISRDYALSLIDAFLVHFALELAVQADEMADNVN